jgi:predicted Zn-dependent protease
MPPLLPDGDYHSRTVKDHFYSLFDLLRRELRAGELLLCNFSGERSDFVRFNHGKVRQAGSVEQRFLTMRLIRARRQAAATMTLGGGSEDLDDLKSTLAMLREGLDALPEDPWLLVNEAPQSTAVERRGKLAPAEAVVEQVVRAARGNEAGAHDLVGFYAGGTLYRGFAASTGQHNWHEVDSFNFDWSLHRQADQAVKASYAGFDWNEGALAAQVDASAHELALLAVPPRALTPGEYRAYLAPRALDEVMGLLAWGGFSARARATRQSPLLRMQEGGALSPLIDLAENTAEGVAPGFQGEGFVKPARVRLIGGGRLGNALVSPRSAKEYGLATNAANGGETPESLDLAPGALPRGEILPALESGLYISNLWYLNYSDRPAARITGMTRFATFWVEGGRIVAPVGPMRFDDNLYRMLGDHLLALTTERELLLDPSTYGERSTASTRLPGALLGALRLTL